VHVTLKFLPPYSQWNVEGLAEQASFVLFANKPFDSSQFPGYMHQTTVKGARKLDTTSKDARQSLRTLVFRRTRHSAGFDVATMRRCACTCATLSAARLKLPLQCIRVIAVICDCCGFWQSLAVESLPCPSAILWLGCLHVSLETGI
jgi:hypothetical protein